jgi:hypothetical protein
MKLARIVLISSQEGEAGLTLQALKRLCDHGA